jgi:hypothetical protein
MLVLAYLMSDCWLESVCIRKVLRLANTIKVFRGFPWPQSKCKDGTQIPRLTGCFVCSPSNGNIIISALMYTPPPLMSDWNSFRWNAFNAECTRYQDMLVDGPSVVTQLWLYFGLDHPISEGYTGCPRRNVPDFGRVFLMVKYTDITQNTYVQS